VTGDNWVAEMNLSNSAGACLVEAGLCGAAIPRFEAALRMQPDFAEANNNLGVCLLNSGRDAEAIAYFEAALRAKPDSAQVHFNLGVTLSKSPGRALEAIAQYEAVLRLRPGDAAAHHNLGALLVSAGRTEEAISHFGAAQRIDPNPERSVTIDRLRAGQR